MIEKVRTTKSVMEEVRYEEPIEIAPAGIILEVRSFDEFDQTVEVEYDGAILVLLEDEWEEA